MAKKPTTGSGAKGQKGGKPPTATKSSKGDGVKTYGSAGPQRKIAIRLRDKYQSEICAALRERFSYGNVMEIPRLEKVVVNMGVGEAVGNPKVLETAVDELTTIAGQRAVVTRARKSISNFKLRAGARIGARVTLRGVRMWTFLDKLFNVVLPRIRDFRGLNGRSFDGRGNFAVGLKEQLIFPEIHYDKVDKTRGMDICIVTTAKTDEEGREFLRMLGCPIRPQ